MDDNEELEKIIKTAYRWDLYAVFSPIFFLVIIGLSIYLNLIESNIAFYIGLSVFGITTVVWWVWTIFTIKKLAITLANVSSKLIWVKGEFKKIREDVKDITSK